jgi:hypothetical protein
VIQCSDCSSSWRVFSVWLLGSSQFGYWLTSLMTRHFWTRWRNMWSSHVYEAMDKHQLESKSSSGNTLLLHSRIGKHIQACSCSWESPALYILSHSSSRVSSPSWATHQRKLSCLRSRRTLWHSYRYYHLCICLDNRPFR